MVLILALKKQEIKASLSTEEMIDSLGGFGADTIDCGRATDSVFDYFPSEGDTITSGCEEIQSSGR